MSSLSTLVQAVFASGDGTALPFTILDRPQRGEQPLLTALDWLYLAHTGHVRAQFARAATGDWEGRWVSP